MVGRLSSPDLSITLNGLHLKNPLILAASGLTYDQTGMISFIKRGFSGVVTKSITWNPCAGTSTKASTSFSTNSPRAFGENGLWMTGSESAYNPGYKKACEAIKIAKKVADEHDAHIIAQVQANSVEQWGQMAAGFEQAGASAIELNMVCPPTIMAKLGIPGFENLGLIWSKDVEKTCAAIKAAKHAVDVPVWPKMHGTNLHDPEKLKRYEDAGTDAFTVSGHYGLFNFPAMFIDVETGKQIGTPPRESALGPLIWPFSVWRISQIARLSKKPLIGSGGIMNGKQVIEAFMVGSDAVQICTGAWWEPTIAERILKEIREFMGKKGYSKLEEVKRIALKLLPRSEQAAQEEIRQAYERDGYMQEEPSLHNIR